MGLLLLSSQDDVEIGSGLLTGLGVLLGSVVVQAVEFVLKDFEVTTEIKDFNVSTVIKDFNVSTVIKDFNVSTIVKEFEVSR